MSIWLLVCVATLAPACIWLMARLCAGAYFQEKFRYHNRIMTMKLEDIQNG